MINTVLELLVAPALVGAATLAARRWGQKIGGLVSAFPAIVGPVLLIAALEHGATFAARAANGTLLGLVALAIFAVAYGWTATRAGWPGSLAAGWAVAGVTGLLVGAIAAGPTGGLAAAAVSLGAAHRLLRRAAGRPHRPAPSRLRARRHGPVRTRSRRPARRRAGRAPLGPAAANGAHGAARRDAHSGGEPLRAGRGRRPRGAARAGLDSRGLHPFAVRRGRGRRPAPRDAGRHGRVRRLLRARRGARRADRGRGVLRGRDGRGARDPGRDRVGRAAGARDTGTRTRLRHAPRPARYGTPIRPRPHGRPPRRCCRPGRARTRRSTAGWYCGRGPGPPLSRPPAATAAAWNASTCAVDSARNATWATVRVPGCSATQNSGRSMPMPTTPGAGSSITR